MLRRLASSLSASGLGSSFARTATDVLSPSCASAGPSSVASTQDTIQSVHSIFSRGKLYVSTGMRIQAQVCTSSRLQLVRLSALRSPAQPPAPLCDPLQSRLKVVDNTGATEVMCLPASFRGKTARVGSIITVSVKKGKGDKAPKGTVQK